MSNHCFVYVVRCSDGALYTGTTHDVDRELRAVNGGECGSWLRARTPVFLAYAEEYMNDGDAEKRAASIRRMSRERKEDLLSIPGLADLGALGYAA
jgi:putative endonuclease